MSGSLNLVRMRYAAIAAKVETTPGTDAIAGTPAASDWLEGDVTINFEQNSIPNPVMTGSLDRAPAIPGALRPAIKITVPLRGSGTPATPPEWGKLLRFTTMQESITAAAIGAPTAATAGTTTTATLQTPFGTVAQAYRGMPMALTVGPIGTTGIIDYTAGRVASFGETLLSTVAVTTLCQIPINVLYSPTSDESVFKTGTVYFFADGLRWRFAGFTGTWSLNITSGGLGFLVFDGRAIFIDFTATAIPTGWNTITRPTAPRWLGGKCQLNRNTARVRSLSIQGGVTTVLPDNPEQSEGYDPAVPTERDVGGTLDPLTDTSLSVARFDAFRFGTNVPLMVIIGSTPGNRFLITLPSIRKTSMNPQDRDGLGVDAISFQGDGNDAAAFICAF